MKVDPTGDDIRRFRDEDDGGPVVMLNLLRFAGDAGRAAYGEYGAKVQPFLDAVGATVVYAGACSTALVAPDEHRWDAMLVVRYPSRSAFLEMVMNPDYQAITELRTTALEAAVLQATTPWA
jgi:uncharacterized protein (DUF1330 family)